MRRLLVFLPWIIGLVAIWWIMRTTGAAAMAERKRRREEFEAALSF